MSEEKEITEKIEDLLFENVNVSSQQVQNGNHQDRLNQKSLTLENLNSLALFPHHSIEKGIPLSKNMLSQDMYPREFSSSEQHEQQSRQVIEEKSQEELIAPEADDSWLVDELGLTKPSRKRKTPENTKNVLRNFGNAQNQYALYNKDAISLIESEITNPTAFYHWIRTLKLENFEGFKAVWSQNTSTSKLFRRLYKKVCWKFYSEAAVPYVLASRMRDTKTKLSHLKYVYRLLEGLRNPEDFTYFKKIEK